MIFKKAAPKQTSNFVSDSFDALGDLVSGVTESIGDGVENVVDEAKQVGGRAIADALENAGGGSRAKPALKKVIGQKEANNGRDYVVVFLETMTEGEAREFYTGLVNTAPEWRPIYVRTHMNIPDLESQSKYMAQFLQLAVRVKDDGLIGDLTLAGIVDFFKERGLDLLSDNTDKNIPSEENPNEIMAAQAGLDHDLSRMQMVLSGLTGDIKNLAYQVAGSFNLNDIPSYFWGNEANTSYVVYGLRRAIEANLISPHQQELLLVLFGYFNRAIALGKGVDRLFGSTGMAEEGMADINELKIEMSTLEGEFVVFKAGIVPEAPTEKEDTGNADAEKLDAIKGIGGRVQSVEVSINNFADGIINNLDVELPEYNGHFRTLERELNRLYAEGDIEIGTAVNLFAAKLLTVELDHFKKRLANFQEDDDMDAEERQAILGVLDMLLEDIERNHARLINSEVGVADYIVFKSFSNVEDQLDDDPISPEEMDERAERLDKDLKHLIDGLAGNLMDQGKLTDYSSGDYEKISDQLAELSEQGEFGEDEDVASRTAIVLFALIALRNDLKGVRDDLDNLSVDENKYLLDLLRARLKKMRKQFDDISFGFNNEGVVDENIAEALLIADEKL